MYRQIKIDPRDQNYQCILWNGEASATPKKYRLSTITYGTASAPFLALRVLQQLIHDEGESYPLAAPILKNYIYVDDVLVGDEYIPLLRHTRDQLCALLQRGGFTLRKWASNNSELLSDIPTDDHGLACNKILNDDESLNVLGISWNPTADVFQFRVSMPKPLPCTKRAILSTIAKLFDPLGWVTPIIITAKIFMQQLWRFKLGLDNNIPPQSFTQWEQIYQYISSLDGVRVPRWVNIGSDTQHCELHGFADASTVAYATVVYIRVISISGETTTVLLASKSKVAPIKPMSVPRLELSAAVLLSRLMHAIQSSIQIKNCSCHSWADSTIALAWIRQHPSKWKVFVAHRVAVIQSKLPNAKWSHVPSGDNPADCASRELKGEEFKSFDLWWTGPHWLRLSSSEWPTESNLATSETQSEARLSSHHIIQRPESWDLSVRYSEWSKLVRITAYIICFADRCRKKTNSPMEAQLSPRAISKTEYEQARNFWLQTVQRDVFHDDLKALRHRQSLSTKSSILSLNPYLYEKGIIRVGGRLENAPLPFTTKHPILLAPHPIVKLLVRQAHMRTLHAGMQLTLSTLRQEFWIIRARNFVKSVLHQYAKCAREKAVVPVQLMGQLPHYRVSTPKRAFLHCGLDYAGPIAVRASKGRGIASRKAYIAVFVCMATRAVHLELVGGYSTLAFLDAYTRFCARRGLLPSDIYSDNGTNFTGADKELTKAYQDSLRDPDFLNKTTADSVSWHFIPPHAPHFGGLWEAGVRSVKHHLRRSLGAHTLTFEELTTLLCQVEACLNSRPLSPLTSSLNDYETLTPGHFLIGSSLTVSPEPSVLHIQENRLSRWQLV